MFLFLHVPHFALPLHIVVFHIYDSIYELFVIPHILPLFFLGRKCLYFLLEGAFGAHLLVNDLEPIDLMPPMAWLRSNSFLPIQPSGATSHYAST